MQITLQFSVQHPKKCVMLPCCCEKTAVCFLHIQECGTKNHHPSGIELLLTLTLNLASLLQKMLCEIKGRNATINLITNVTLLSTVNCAMNVADQSCQSLESHARCHLVTALATTIPPEMITISNGNQFKKPLRKKIFYGKMFYKFNYFENPKYALKKYDSYRFASFSLSHLHLSFLKISSHMSLSLTCLSLSFHLSLLICLSLFTARPLLICLFLTSQLALSLSSSLSS